MLLFYASLFSYFLYTILKYRNALYMLQQNSYNTSNRYIKWINKNYSRCFLTYDLLFVVMFGLYYILDTNFFSLAILVFYLIIFYLELKKLKTIQVKKPFVVTSRIKRLSITLLLIFLIVSIYIGFNFDKNIVLIYYITYMFLSYLSYLIVYTANIINKPIEKCVYYYYKNKAVTKLKNMNNLIKIGITGSYGKTTSKNILNEILNSKYNSFATPKSFNTPYGLMNSINNNLDKFDNIFIAEMGACKLGDIKELCDFIKPKYGIITKIGKAHLETFKSLDNTTLEKFKLIESLPSDGVGILNADDPYQKNYKIKNNCQIIWIGIDDPSASICAKNISIEDTGMKFTIMIDKQNHEFQTPLLGRANIYNILVAVALANYLKIDIEDIKTSIKRLKPTEHRLELRKLNDITIIDDAFNSNPEGSKMALEVLDLMKGTKIIVTPGMIELGQSQYEENYNFGISMAKVCNHVILIGESQTKPIYEGLLKANYDKKNIHILNDVKESFKLINRIKGKNTYVLLENDLPDIFNEK